MTEVWYKYYCSGDCNHNQEPSRRSVKIKEQYDVHRQGINRSLKLRQKDLQRV